MEQRIMLVMDEERLLRFMVAPPALHERSSLPSNGTREALARPAEAQPQAWAFDPLFTDSSAAGMSGRGRSPKIRGAGSGVPVLIIAGGVSADGPARLKDEGAPVLQEPFTVFELIDAVREAYLRASFRHGRQRGGIQHE